MSYWTPPNDWAGQDAILIGGGASLRGFDFESLSGRNVIGCNDAFHLGPEIVKYCVFGDAAWFYRNKFQIMESKVQFVTCAPLLTNLNWNPLLRVRRELHGIHPGSSAGWNQCTGALAINIAINLGATRIFLLGYDINNQGNKSHWHDHNKLPTKEYSFQRFLRGFAKVKESLPQGVEVFNVTDGSSRLHCFVRKNWPEFWQMLQEKQPALTI